MNMGCWFSSHSKLKTPAIASASITVFVYCFVIMKNSWLYDAGCACIRNQGRLLSLLPSCLCMLLCYHWEFRFIGQVFFAFRPKDTCFRFFFPPLSLYFFDIKLKLFYYADILRFLHSKSSRRSLPSCFIVVVVQDATLWDRLFS